MLLLEVLPGWPEPNELSGLQLLLLTVIVPLAVGAVITAIGMAPKLMQRNRAEAAAAGLGEAVEVDAPELEPAAGRRAITE